MTKDKKISLNLELELINDYLHGMKTKEIQSKYGISRYMDILDKHDVQLKNGKNQRWTKQQLEILKQFYPTSSWEILLDKLPNFNKQLIMSKASYLKLKRKNTWSFEEEKILIENYHKGIKFIEKILPNRSISSIQSKASKLKLSTLKSWTDQEDQILVENYENRTNKFIQKLLPDKKISAIIERANTLGLKKIKTNTQYEKEFMIKKLQEFAFQLGRTPTSNEVLENKKIPSLSSYVRYFGNYTDACVACNLKINDSPIYGQVQKHRAKDGTICLSKPELTITNFFIDNKISFKKEKSYSEICDDLNFGKMKMDWYVSNRIIIEYFGMDDKKEYKEKMELKKKLCKKNNLKLISLTKKDLKNLENILEILSQ